MVIKGKVYLNFTSYKTLYLKTGHFVSIPPMRRNYIKELPNTYNTTFISLRYKNKFSYLSKKSFYQKIPRDLTDERYENIISTDHIRILRIISFG